MDRDTFETGLRADGFREVTESAMPPNTLRPQHERPFEIRGLVLAGVMHLASDDSEQRFGPGEVFTMLAGKPHFERTGAEGAHLLAGRRWAAQPASGD